jgi:transposase-like protein
VIPSIIVGVVVVALVVLLLVWGMFSGPRCPRCKKKGGVTLKDRTAVGTKGDQTVYHDRFECHRCGCTYTEIKEEACDSTGGPTGIV